MDADRQALELVLAAITANPRGSFARDAFLQMLQLLPPVPKVPGAPVFFELARKGVFLAVELVLFKDAMAGEVLLTHRKDEFFTGWHFPGTYRAPGVPLIADVERCVDKEIGGIQVTRVRPLGWFEHPESPRFHDAGMLVVCDFEGTPADGQWFSTRVRPPDLIEVHHPYWEMIARERDARLVTP